MPTLYTVPENEKEKNHRPESSMVALAGVDIEEKHWVKLQVPYNTVDNILFQASTLVIHGNDTKEGFDIPVA